MAPAPARQPGEGTLRILEDLAQHASRERLDLAEALLTDLLAIVHGWPVPSMRDEGAEDRAVRSCRSRLGH